MKEMKDICFVGDTVSVVEAVNDNTRIMRKAIKRAGHQNFLLFMAGAITAYAIEKQVENLNGRVKTLEKEVRELKAGKE